MPARIRPYLSRLKAFAEAYVALVAAGSELLKVLEATEQTALPGYPAGRWEDFETVHLEIHRGATLAKDWTSEAYLAAAEQDKDRGVLSVYAVDSGQKQDARVSVEWADDAGNQETLTWEEARQLARRSPEFADMLLEAVRGGGGCYKPGSKLR